jgi:ankyrin repeat protein
MAAQPPDHHTVFEAATAGQWGPVEAAILGGFDVNAADEYGYTLLHHASGYSRPPSLHIVRLLLARGINVDALSGMNGVALHWAANGADAAIVGALCDAGANPNVVSAYRKRCDKWEGIS